MFGHKWQEGEGTVRETRVSRLGPGDNSPIITHYLIDVQPSSGEPFRTEVREPMVEREEKEDRARSEPS